MPLTPNENLIFATQSQRISVTPDSEQLIKDTTTQGVFVGDGTTAGGRAIDTRVSETVTGTYTLDRGDEAKVLHFNSSSAFTVTLPTNADVPFPVGLTRIPFLNIGAGVVSISASVGVTLSSSVTTIDEGESGYIVKLNTDEWFVTKGNRPDSQSLAGLTDVQLTSVANGQALMYDSSTGKWENQTISTTDTTYDLSIPTDTTKIRLTGSDGTTDDITVTAGTGITVTRTSGTELTIASTASDTTYALGSSAAGSNATIDLTDSVGGSTSVTLAAGTNMSISETASTITLTSDKYTDAEAVQAIESEAVLDLTGEMSLAGDFTVDTSTLKVDTLNNRVGVLNTSPETALDVGGTIRQDGATTGIVYANADGDLLGGRSIAGGTGITVTNANGVAGNPTISTTITQYTDALAVSAVEAESTLALTGAVTIASTLGVTGATTLGSTVGITGATSIGSTLGVTGNTTVGGTMGVTGATTLSDALTVSGATTLSGGATISGDLTVDTSTMKIDSTNNRVGIVQSSPAYPLDVTGDVNFTGTLRKSGTAFALTDLGDTNISSPTNAQVLQYNSTSGKWEAGDDVDTDTTYSIAVPDSTTKVRLTGSDSSTSDITLTGGTNVTVTRSSATELSISSVAGFSRYTDAEAVSAVEASDLTFSGTVDLADGLTVGSGTPKDMVVDVTNSRTGINVDSPTEALDVLGNFQLSGNAVIGGNLTVNGTTTTVNTQTLSVEDPIILLSKDNAANSVDIGFVGKYVDTNTYYTGLVRDSSAGKFRLFTTTEDLSTATVVDPTNAGYANSSLVINDLEAQAITGTTFTGSGAISGASISVTGDASAGGALTVTGDASAGGNLSVTGTATVGGGATFDSTTLVVDATNNRIGFGTASPTVDIDGTGKTLIVGQVQIGDVGERIGRPVDNELAIFTGGTERMRFDDSGNVGIGTDPTVALDVAGAIKQTSVTSKVIIADADGDLVGVTDGSSGQMLTTDGSGGYSFTTATGTYTDSMAIAAVEGESTLALTGAVTMASTLGVTGAITGASLSTTGDISGAALTGVGSLTLTHAGTDLFADIIGPVNRNLRFKLRDNGDADAFQFFNTANTELMTLQRTGHLGIGVTDPSYHVDAGGDINFTGTLRKSGTAFGLGDLGNVTLTSPSTNDRLVWNGSAWVNQARPADNNTTYTYAVPDSTTKLRLTGSDSTTNDINVTGGTNVTVTRVSGSELSIASTDTDTTYSLSSGTSGSNATIDLTAGGSGSGTSTVTLAGAGATSISETGDTITITSSDTTYDLTVPASTTAIRLTDGTNDDDITIAGGGDTTVTRTSATQLTVSTTKYTDAEAVSAVEGEGTLNLSGITSVASDFKVDTDTLFVDVSTDRVGINDATPSYSLDVTGTGRITSELMGQSTQGFTPNTYKLGNVGSGTDADWFKVATWTTVNPEQYDSFQAHIRVNGRGNFPVYYDLVVRGGFNTTASGGWFYKQCDLYTPQGISNDDTFRVIFNAGDDSGSGAAPAASLYYRRGGGSPGSDWDDRIFTFVSHARTGGTTFTYQNTNVGETTPATDGHSNSAAVDVTVKKFLNDTDAFTFNNNLTISGTKKLIVGDSEIWDDGANMKIRGQTQIQYQTLGQYGAHQFYNSLGTAGDTVLTARINYLGDFQTFDSNGDTLLYADRSTARLGINTNAPGTQLHVYQDSADSVLRVERSSRVQLDILAQENNGLVRTTNDYPLYLGANSTTVATITGTGRLGVNTTNPSKTLHVNGASHLGGTTSYAEVSSNGSIEFVHSATAQTYLDFKDDATDDFDSRIIKYGGSHASQANKLQLWNNTGLLELKTNSHDVVVNSGTGILKLNMNTATTDTGSVLSFTAGDSGATSSEHSYAQIAGLIETPTDTEEDGYLRFSTSLDGTMTEYMRLDSSGRLGVGVTDPTSRLHVSSGSGYLKFDTSGSVGSIKSDFNLDLYADDTGNNSASYQNIRFFTAGSNERMRLTGVGKLGIGETSPTFPLHLKYADGRTDPQGSGSSSGAGAIGADAEGGGLYIENTSTTVGAWSGATFRVGTADARIAYKSIGTNQGQMSFYLDANDSPNQLTLEEVLRLKGGNTGSGQTFNSVDLPTNDARLRLGASQQLEFKFDGSHTRITHDAATDSWMIIKNEDGAGIQLNIGSDKGIEINKDNNVELYYDGGLRVETQSTGAKVSGRLHVSDAADSIIVGGDNGDAGIFSYGSGQLLLGNDYDEDSTYEALIAVDGDGGTSSLIGLSNHISIETQRSGDDIFFKTGTNTTNDGNLTTQMKIEGTGEIDLVSGKLRIAGSAGAAGQVLRMNSGATGIEWGSVSAGTSTTINNNADNRIITGSNTANTLEAESGFTFLNGGIFNVIEGTSGNNTSVNATMTMRTKYGPSSTTQTALYMESDDYRGAGVFYKSNDTGSYTPWFAGRGYASTAFHIGSHATQSDRIANSQLSILTNGNVGISDSSPSYPMSISSASGLAIQTSNALREKRIYASTVSPYDIMNYHSKGSTGGWSGQHSFLVDKNGSSTYEAMIIRDDGNGTKPEVMIGEGYSTTSDPPGLLNLKSDKDILMHMENTGNLWVRFRVDTSGSDFHIDTNIKDSVIKIDGGASDVTFSDSVFVTDNLTVDGNLTVNGTTTTVNTETLSVEDPLILLANGNTANTVDTGFVAKYTDTDNYWTGLVKDSGSGTASRPLYRLFTTQEDLSTATTINTGATGYGVAELNTGPITLDYTHATAAPGNGKVILSAHADDNATLRIRNEHGNLEIGPRNTSNMHFYTDRANYFFDTRVVVDTGNIASYNEDLSLQTGSTTRMTLDVNDGFIGINNTNPAARLDIIESTGVGSTAGDTKLLSRYKISGGTGNQIYDNVYHVRNGDGATEWTGVNYKRGWSIDTTSPTVGYQGSGSSTLRAFHEVDLQLGTQYFGHTSSYILTLDGQNTKVGVNSVAPTSSLTVGNSATTQTLSLGQRATGNAAGRTILLEGLAQSGNGEGSGRLFFTEHNGTSASADKYGLSLYYEGNGSTALPSGFNSGTNNATWGIKRHDNSVNGNLVLGGSRSSSDVQFYGKLGVGTSASAQIEAVRTITGNSATALGHVDLLKLDSIDDGSTSRGPSMITRIGATTDHNGADYVNHLTGDGGGFILHHYGNNWGYNEYWHTANTDGFKKIARLHADGNAGTAGGNMAGILDLYDDSVVFNPSGTAYTVTGSNVGVRLRANGDSYFTNQSGQTQVGIGTTSPSLNLEVYDASDANIRVRGNSNYAITLEVTSSGTKMHHGDTDSSEGSFMTFGAFSGINQIDTTNRDFHIYGSNTATGFYFDESTGRFGLGTSSPGEQLELTGSIQLAHSQALKFNSTNSYLGANSDSSDVTLSADDDLILMADDDLLFRTAGTYNMVLTNDAKLGVGTTSPDYTVDIQPGTNVGVGLNVQNMIQDVNGRPNHNLVPSHQWTIGTGSVGNFSQNGETSENARVWGAGPRQDGNGGRQILWQMTNQDTGGGDGGWNTSLIPVDHTKMYRWTVWAKQVGAQSGDGSMSMYLGLRGYNAAGSNEGVLNSGGSGSANTNPYFWSGDLPEADKWYLIVGYAQGSGDTTAGNVGSGVYDPVTGKRVLAGSTFALQTTTTHVIHRAYIFYYDAIDSDPDAYFWGPTLECCDGNEAPLSTLLSHGSSSSPGYFFSKDDDTVVCIENDSPNADANATLRLVSSHGSDTWTELTENTYGNFSITGGASTRREIIRMTDHDTTTGNFAIDPTGVGFSTRIGSVGTNDQGIKLVVGDDLGLTFASDAEMVSIGGSTGTNDAGVVMGEDSNNLAIMRFSSGGNSYEPYMVFNSVEAGTTYAQTMSFKGGLTHFNVAATDLGSVTDAQVQINQGGLNEGIRIDGTGVNGSMRFQRNDTSLTGGEVIGQLKFSSNDTNDTNINARMKVFKDDGAVSYAPMAFSFETGREGNEAERMRITSAGMVHIGDTSPVTSITGGSPSMLQISSQTSNQFPTLTLEYYDTTPNPDKYVVGKFLLGTNAVKVGSFDNNNSTLRFFTADLQAVKIHGPDDADGERKVTFGPLEAEPSYRMLIQSTDKEGGASPTGSSLIQFTNEDTGTGSGDGVLIGLDASENALIEAKESGKKVKITAPSGVEFNGAYTFPTSDGSANQVLQTDGSGTLSFANAGGSSLTTGMTKPAVFMDSGSVNVTLTETTIPFDTEVLDPSANAFIVSGLGNDGKIRIATAGYYRISYSIPINDDGSTGSDRTRIYTKVEKATDDAFTTGLQTIAQSRAQVYTREASGGSGLSTSFICQLAAAQRIRVRIDAQNNTDISTESNQSQISIEYLGS